MLAKLPDRPSGCKRGFSLQQAVRAELVDELVETFLEEVPQVPVESGNAVSGRRLG
jgi:hypothetical protein